MLVPSVLRRAPSGMRTCPEDRRKRVGRRAPLQFMSNGDGRGPGRRAIVPLVPKGELSGFGSLLNRPARLQFEIAQEQGPRWPLV